MDSTKKQLLHLISVGHLVKSSELIDIYAKRGFNTMSIRNTLSKLKKLNLIRTMKRGVYEITESGQEYIDVLNNKYIPEDHFNDIFYFVLLNIPEKNRKEKDSFKTVLTQYGFGAYLSNIYISPNDNRAEIKVVAHNMALTQYVSTISGTWDEPNLNDDLIQKIWQLDKVRTLYKTVNAFLINIKPEDLTDDSDLFNLYLDIGNFISNIFITDPFLPAELLPTDWQYHHTLQHLFSTYDKIAHTLRNSKFNKFIE
ncbi:hypothetical protein C5Z25_09690 [Lactobacillus sp. CBA3605]|uniref:PaaX family transcriptional regulator C-terminal domain-containing protein n=1 Tax=Lactobacillus sp. CBA3605 TaxID=2099788 RepID=UPI000CFAF8A4|nr:PaaX family transcriptional regulator C-terminal domain-containing protein [Lactobacillus sp. CBA3605]AVK62027.1 hypothetical protein C5Z25_09690 [Lactobacillus sp. CBA3605]